MASSHPEVASSDDDILKDITKVSTYLSEVMSDIYVTEKTVQLRRKVGLRRETMKDFRILYHAPPHRTYNFGSQTDGKYV